MTAKVPTCEICGGETHPFFAWSATTVATTMTLDSEKIRWLAKDWEDFAEEDAKTPSADFVGLNFRVPEEFAWAFKQAALSAKLKQNKFLYYLLELHEMVTPKEPA